MGRIHFAGILTVLFGNEGTGTVHSGKAVLLIRYSYVHRRYTYVTHTLAYVMHILLIRVYMLCICT